MFSKVISFTSTGVQTLLTDLSSLQQTAELQAIKEEVSRLADAMQLQAQAFERQLKPITDLATLLATLIRNSVPQD